MPSRHRDRFTTRTVEVHRAEVDDRLAEKSHSRALPRVPMLASIGLATICHAIIAMIVAGFEPVSDPNPTARSTDMPSASNTNPSPFRTRESLGVESDPGE